MTYAHKLDIIIRRLHAQPRIILGVSCRERVGQMTQPTIAEPSSFSPFGEKINAVNARYRAPFRRPAESEVVAAPVMRFALTDAELLVGAVLFGTIGLMGLVELASGQALAFGLADRQITRTRRTVSGVIGAGSLAIASVASFTLARRYATIIANESD